MFILVLINLPTSQFFHNILLDISHWDACLLSDPQKHSSYAILIGWWTYLSGMGSITSHKYHPWTAPPLSDPSSASDLLWHPLHEFCLTVRRQSFAWSVDAILPSPVYYVLACLCLCSLHSWHTPQLGKVLICWMSHHGCSTMCELTF